MNIVEFAKDVAPNTQVVLTTKTSVKMNKKDVETKSEPNPFGNIYKTSKLLVTLNASYEDRVNEARAKEGIDEDFVASKPVWGESVGNALIENKGQLYIQCIEEERVGSSDYMDEEGNPVNYNDIKKFIPGYTGPSKQGVVDTVKVRRFKVESIVEYVTV